MWQANLSWEDAKKRAEIIATIRQFFTTREVIEVETPLLSHGTVTDVHLDAFSTTAYPAIDNKLMYLQTSPEFAMKRLLASGFQSIYQICKAFRYEDSGRFHNAEFTMLEWYRLGFDHYALMDEVDELLQYVLACEPSDKFTYQQLFQTYLNIDPLNTDLNELKACLAANNILGDWITAEKDLDVLLQVLFSEVIERQIGKERPVMVYHYPSSQAALAKISKEDNRVAERFECYFHGIELANGFHELVNASEQAERFKQDNLKRKAIGKPEMPIDDNFLQALEVGLPKCAGVALGVDRLLMIALKKTSIEKVLTFTTENA